MSTLYVGNLSSHVRHRQLENTFRRFGRSYLELKDGYGFVVYEEFRDAQKALKSLQGRSVCGEQPSIKWARGKRSFPRNSGSGPSTRMGSWDKHHSQAIRRRKSVDRSVQVVDEVSRPSNSRENMVTSPGRGEEVKDVGVDPLDSGRWDPHMEDSPQNMISDGLIDDEEEILDDKDKEDERGGTHEKAHGSPGERHNEGSSRGYHNSSDRVRRGRDVPGRLQERCYNCGQFGHVKWQCRSRLREPILHNGRRIEARYLGCRSGFRGAIGHFRGMNRSRRMLQKDIERDFTVRSSRRHDAMGHKRHHGPLDAKPHGKTKRRRHRSESPNDSSSRGRSKRKHKKVSKKSPRSSRKRKRSSSSSLSRPTSGHFSSSSPSGSRSSSRSGSDSASAASSRSSSGPGSQSSSSVSPSPSSSKGQSSRSCSSSSASRSRSACSGSRKSISKSISCSPNDSHSPRSNGIALHDSAQDSRSPRREVDREGAIADKSTLQSKQMFDLNHDRDETDNGDRLPENQELDEQEEARIRERRQVWSREKRSQNKSDSEVARHAAHIDTNGWSHGVNSRIRGDAQPSVMQIAECSATDPSATEMTGEIIDTKYNMYMGVRSSVDGGQEMYTAGGFAMARMWPLDAILYRRLKRGLITTANYERRKAQNLEFGIEDKFVRSSSGWWEEEEKITN